MEWLMSVLYEGGPNRTEYFYTRQNLKWELYLQVPTLSNVDSKFILLADLC